MPKLPRGIRNNNPGNIRKGDNWDGLDLTKTKEEKAFCVFKEVRYGIRALTKILINYNRRYGIDTVDGILKRYAPPAENDTASYIDHVAKELKVSPIERINILTPHTMSVLVKAIIKHENGMQPYSDEEINAGMFLAGIS